MSRILRKKRALLVTAVTSLALVAVALAYYTTLGEGTSTGSSTEAGYANKLLIEATVPPGVVPGATVQLTGEKVTNPAGNPGTARVSTITATDIDVGLANESDACNDAWFTITDIPVNANLASGANTTFSAALTMANAVDGGGAPVNQDACKNQPISIEWDSDDTE
jgi:hypothetical protein